MIETVFHFFKIHRKMIFGNPAIIVQNMFSITPKTLNAVDMILATIGKGFVMIQTMVLAQPLQGIVTAKSICIINRSFFRMLSDMRHQFIGSNLFHHFGIDLPFTLQKAKNNAFASRSSSALAFAPSTEIRLVNLNLAFQSAGFQFSRMVDRFTQTLIDASYYLIIQTKITGYTIGRLLLVETGKDADLFAQLFQRLLFSTGFSSAFHITATSFTNIKRTAKYALSTPQKVGRTIENVLFPHNHKDILTPRGYETH